MDSGKHLSRRVWSNKLSRVDIHFTTSTFVRFQHMTLKHRQTQTSKTIIRLQPNTRPPPKTRHAKIPRLNPVVLKKAFPCSVHGRQWRQYVHVGQTRDACPRQSKELGHKRVVHQLSVGDMGRFDVLEDPRCEPACVPTQKVSSGAGLHWCVPSIGPSDGHQRTVRCAESLRSAHGHVRAEETWCRRPVCDVHLILILGSHSTSVTSTHSLPCSPPLFGTCG